MDFDELLEHLRFEYWATTAADPDLQDPWCPRMIDMDRAPSFYDFLLSRGFSRFQLSAYGVGRDIGA